MGWWFVHGAGAVVLVWAAVAMLWPDRLPEAARPPTPPTWEEAVAEGLGKLTIDPDHIALPQFEGGIMIFPKEQIAISCREDGIGIVVADRLEYTVAGPSAMGWEGGRTAPGDAPDPARLSGLCRAVKERLQ